LVRQPIRRAVDLPSKALRTNAGVPLQTENTDGEGGEAISPARILIIAL
jgi:hypothetical protein